MTSIVWLRRDLRLHDHAALATALAAKHEVQPAFIFDTDILARFSNPHDRRLSFIAAALCHMDAQLQTRGGRLLVLHGKPIDIMPKLATALGSAAIFSAEDFEPKTRARDAAVKAQLPAATRFVHVLDHLMRAPQHTMKGDGTPYKVFTPFYKVWRSALGPTDWAEYAVKDKGRYADFVHVTRAVKQAGLTHVSLEQGPEAVLKHIGYVYTKDTLWTVTDAQKRLQLFIDGRMRQYPTARDQLPIIGTSQIAPYLRHGLVSIRECMRAADAAGYGEKWISELGWREFYAGILFHFPEVEEHEFTPHYRHGAIPWSRDKQLAQAFYEGKTGYPVVDAAVRELLETGYMHNRARMIVASFVTKDLLLDWRLGEEFFAQHLMDYELASNNGGWQWAASTGTDAAPYFRVFNPVLQSKKFDPEGDYIKRYVTELNCLNKEDVHAPWRSPLTKPKGYPDPIVDHALVKEKVLGLFKKAGLNKPGNLPRALP